MNGLALCAGIDGIGLALSLVDPEYRTICVVEREAYAAAVLAKRMEEGTMASCPIWDDLGTFDGRRWRGLVDIVHAGLPCQPFSVAGRRQGDQDERYLWPDFFRILDDVRSPMVFLENVPGLVAWFRPIGEELCRLGYEFEAGIFSAAECGASHRRERLFILGHSICARRPTTRPRRYQYTGQKSETGSRRLADARQPRLEGRPSLRRDAERECATAVRSCLSLFPPGPSEREAWAAILERWPELAPALAEEEAEPELRRLAAGTPDELVQRFRVDRLRCDGNLAVPICAAFAFLTLSKRSGVL